MALLRGIVKSSEYFLRNPSAQKNAWNNDIYYSVKKSLNFPPPPKKPLTAYMIFCQDKRKKYPNLSSIEQVKKLAVDWNCLDDSMREPYENKARESTVLYGEAHKKYYENLTDEQRQILTEAIEQKKEAKRLQRLKKELRESGMPKTPLLAYTLFVKSEAKGKDIKIAAEFIKECAMKWKTFSEAERKPFYEQSEKEKLQFNDVLSAWKKQLVAEGKAKLLQQYEELKDKR